MADYLTKSSERASESDHQNAIALARYNIASVNEWKMVIEMVKLMNYYYVNHIYLS